MNSTTHRLLTIVLASGALASFVALADTPARPNKSPPTVPTATPHEPKPGMPDTTGSTTDVTDPGSRTTRLPGVARPAVTVNVAELVREWPTESQTAAKEMLQKYGEPNETTSSMLIWRNTGRFTRSVVYKEPIAHDFPVPHKDVLEQVIDYKVAPDKIDDLAQFDGSIVAFRTNGELSARCDSEASNTLALNVADDVIKGRRGVQDARDFMAKTIGQIAMGEKPAATTALFVELFTDDTEFKDKPAKAAMNAVKKAQQRPAEPQPESATPGTGMNGTLPPEKK